MHKKRLTKDYTLVLRKYEEDEEIEYLIRDQKYTLVECKVDIEKVNGYIFIKSINRVSPDIEATASRLLIEILNLDPISQGFEGNSLQDARGFWKKIGADINPNGHFVLKKEQLENYLKQKGAI